MKLSVVIITQAGGVAAPVGGQIFSEILPYLEVNQGNPDEVEAKEKVSVPDVMGKTLTDATKVLKEQGFEVKINGDTEGLNQDEVLVREQIPSGGIEAGSGSCIYLN